jgi:hypothetical protein
MSTGGGIVIKSFQLAGREYVVRKLKNDPESLGQCNTALGIIEVSDNWCGVRIPNISQEQTLYHEVMHAIFDEIGRLDLSQDETLVQSVSILVHQFVKTME